MKTEQILSRLENIKTSGSGWTARCPGHEDKQNSLSIGNANNGGTVVKCFAGCEPESIMSSIGLSLSDLMPEQEIKDKPRETVYRLPELDNGTIVEHVRIDNPDGSKKFLWKTNGKLGLFGVKIADIPLYKPEKQGDDPRITICEGEKSAIAACRHGLRAWGTVSGANGCPSDKVLKSICDKQEVVIWADNDEPGELHASRLLSKIKPFSKSVCVIRTGHKKDDAADWFGSKSELEAIIATAQGEQNKPPTRKLYEGVGDAAAAILRFSLGDHSDRVQVGIRKIDNALMGGMMAGAVYLIGAPSGGGKTTWLQQMAVDASKGGPVLLVSPEMTLTELAQREIIKRSGFDIFSVAPWVRPDDRVVAERAHRLASEILMEEKMPVHILENIEATMPEIEERAAELKGIRLVILDYAQEIADIDSKLARYLAVGELGKDAIKLGRRCNCPVVVASQVNQSKGTRGEVEYSFRESGKLHHKANTSMILEVKWNKNANRDGFFEVEGARIFALKNRGGPMFNIPVEYVPGLYRINDLSPRNTAMVRQHNESEGY